MLQRVLLGIAFCMLLSSCEDSTRVQPKLVNVIDRAADKPSQTSYNTSLTFSSAGLLRAILHAGRIQTFDSKRYTYLDSSVRVDFFDKLGKHSSRLTSVSAKVNSDNNMTAYGKVHIVSDSGTVVDTDSLEWHNREQTISSEAAVRIAEKSGRVTTGVGFQSDQSLTHYRITHPTIQAPTGSFQSGSSSSSSMRPAQPVIPGSGAINSSQGMGLPSITDSTKK